MRGFRSVRDLKRDGDRIRLGDRPALESRKALRVGRDLVSLARYTSPMPPAPSGERIS